MFVKCWNPLGTIKEKREEKFFQVYKKGFSLDDQQLY